MKKINNCAPTHVSSAPVVHYPIAIPTNQSFCKQWYRWIHKKVSRHFKRNQERINDTVQSVFLRLLKKDTIGRWFFKHLTDELVDRPEAERILGGIKLMFISQVSPTVGRRSDPDSLWRIKDLLAYAKFDYERYYYSIQNHTIDSQKVLRLLGYGSLDQNGKWVVDSKDVSVLESLYRQGRLRPSELTEHECSAMYQIQKSSGGQCSEPGCGKKHFSRGYCNAHYGHFKTKPCAGCDHGRKLMASRNLSLTHRWGSPESIDAALKLRWNDNQLASFLREWQRQNMVTDTPRHIMRTSRNNGIDAGLLAYAQLLIDNAVVNEFKTLTRSDDISNMVLKDRPAPEMSDSEIMAWEGEKGEENSERIVRDVTSLNAFRDFENHHDASRLRSISDLTHDELRTLSEVDIGEMPIRDFAGSSGKSVVQIQKVRASAIEKMRISDNSDRLSDIFIADLMHQICNKYGISSRDIFSSISVGPAVMARTDLFSALHAIGMPPSTISSRFSYPLDKVLAALYRASRRANNSSSLMA